MKRVRWGCCSSALFLVVLLCVAQATADAATPGGGVLELERARLLETPSETPPRDDDIGWRDVTLPLAAPAARTPALWLRLDFDAPPGARAWALYLPYLYGGGDVWLNRLPLGSVPQADASYHVRWERPHLFPIPDPALHEGPNTLLIRVAASHTPNGLSSPRPVVGPQQSLIQLSDRRLLWMRTMPQITVAVCLLFALFVGFVWLRRRGEVLYGLFALAMALWAVRTLTFVVERMPQDDWTLWRIGYHSATGGFIVSMSIFGMRFAGIRSAWTERALLAYWLVGPLALLASGGRADSVVGRLWTLGMIPVGISVIVFVGIAWWRQRSAAAAALLVAVSLAVGTGIYDYLLAWHVDVLDRFAPGWGGQRVFLLHFGADLVLLVMACLLTSRFLRTLREVEELNDSLERRVARRETELAENYRRLGTLERERAAAEERQRIMRDLHDGLGSRLFTSLSRAERGSLPDGEFTDTLRACIADMRVALDALASDEADFGTALGNFLFRWEGPLREAGVRPEWNLCVADEAHRVPPHVALQILHILQEALTNVLKHAHATEVRVDVIGTSSRLTIRVEDDGRGIGPDTVGGGRGLTNMRTRARRVGASIAFRSLPGRTCLELRLPGEESPVGEAEAQAAGAA